MKSNQFDKSKKSSGADSRKNSSGSNRPEKRNDSRKSSLKREPTKAPRFGKKETPKSSEFKEKGSFDKTNKLERNNKPNKNAASSRYHNSDKEGNSTKFSKPSRNNQEKDFKTNSERGIRNNTRGKNTEKNTTEKEGFSNKFSKTSKDRYSKDSKPTFERGLRKNAGDNFKNKKSFSKTDSSGEENKNATFRKGGSKENYSKRSFSKRERPKSFKPSKTQTPNISNPDGLIRLNRYISNAGICSRRDADQLIEQGLITVNGEVVTELGYKVKLTDKVNYESRQLRPERMVYLLLNKPKDFITTMDDPEERKTVMDLVKNACPERIYPVGRLDRNTTGLLLLTNDGNLAEKLTHPSHDVSKIYQVDIDKPITDGDFEQLIKGVRLEDGLVKVKDAALVSPDKKILGVEITEGRNRVVRRMFEALGYVVVKLDRVMYAGLTKKDLPRGNWRFLSDKEVVQLKKNIKAF
jgi:23S rRNA pseudouridine2605 synthase